jgi:hypothetical protein
MNSRIAFGSNCTCLFVVVVDTLYPGMIAQGIIQVHCPTPNHRENVIDAVFSQQLSDVVSNFYSHCYNHLSRFNQDGQIGF